MKLEINTWQRVMLTAVVGQLRGNVHLLRKAIKVLDILEMTDEEKQAIGYTELSTGARWDDTERRFPLEFDQEAITLIQQAIERFEGWPAEQAALVFDLCQQLEMDDDQAEGSR